jgi:glutamate-1-semialdehyde aminotransferase
MPNKVSFNQDYPNISNSLEYYKLAVDLIPSQTQTLAKGTSQYVKGIAPIFAKSAKGCRLTDVDGNVYIDYTMAVGPLSLGYTNQVVDDAILNQLKKGITFSLPHTLEVEVASIIRDIIPNTEMVRFSKTGADVASAAIRLARAFTGKSTILCCGYHGWHDWYIGVTDKNLGIPDEIQNLTYTFNYNDFESVLNAIDDDTAAIILEPVTFDEPHDDFLNKIREICTQKGIVLIFDEMWTGFRMALGGAQEYFGIKADLAIFSKAVANGMPISILTGSKKIMSLLEDKVFFYTTFGGEALSLAAVKATIEELKLNNVPDYLDKKGKVLKDAYNSTAKNLGMDYTFAKGYNFRSMVVFNNPEYDGLLLKSILQQELLKCGILWSGFHNMSFAHKMEDISHTIDSYKVCLKNLKTAVDSGKPEKYLRGEKLKGVFRKTSNFNTKPKRNPNE